jgi:hypothetical protein
VALKNIAEPVEVFAALPGPPAPWGGAARPAADHAAPFALAGAAASPSSPACRGVVPRAPTGAGDGLSLAGLARHRPARLIAVLPFVDLGGEAESR